MNKVLFSLLALGLLLATTAQAHHGVGHHDDHEMDHEHDVEDLHGDVERDDDDDNDYPEIEDFQQESSTETSITVTWNLDTSQAQPLKYRITINDLLSNEFLCPNPSCSYTVSNLLPCDEYQLTLVAIFKVGETEDTNKPQTIPGTTAYSVPGAISNLDDNGNKITWNAPSNEQCVTYYRVCSTSEFFVTTDCVNVTSTEWNYAQSSGCDLLSVSVVAATADGQFGPVSVIQVSTEYGVPSEPRNFAVEFVTDTEILLEWDAPATNAACISDFSIVYGPHEVSPATTNTIIPFNPKAKADFTATLTSLELCTNYQIEVAAVSTSDELGPPAVDYAQTPDSAPGDIPNVSIEPGADEVVVSWGDGNLDACLGFIRICYSDPVEGKVVCDLIDAGDNPNGNFSVTGLSPCRGYTFVVQGVSPEYENGTYSTIISETVDVQPGPVRNLEVSTVSETSLGVAWDKPENYPDCVQEYQITYTNILDLSSKSKSVTPTLRADFEDTLSGLEPCVNYKVEVIAVTATGKRSPARDTNGQTAETPPSAPRNGKFAGATKDSVTVLFYAPLERFCVESYVAFFTHGNQNIEIPFVPSVPYAEQFLNTFQSSEFEPCTTYNMEMEAINTFHPNNDFMTLEVATACE